MTFLRASFYSYFLNYNKYFKIFFLISPTHFGVNYCEGKSTAGLIFFKFDPYLKNYNDKTQWQ